MSWLKLSPWSGRQVKLQLLKEIRRTRVVPAGSGVPVRYWVSPSRETRWAMLRRPGLPPLDWPLLDWPLLAGGASGRRLPTSTEYQPSPVTFRTSLSLADGSTRRTWAR